MTFVSGKGTDTGTCASPANPWRIFQFAIGQTSAFGEIKALDPAPYGIMVITKSISISGVEGAGIDHATAGPDAITINAGPNDKIILSHLTLDGLKRYNNGIVLHSGGSLTITHCVIRNFVQIGQLLVPVAAVKFLIGDTLVSDNTNIGIFVAPIAPVSAQGTLDHVLMNHNSNGIVVDGSSGSFGLASVTSVDSSATNNTGVGIDVRAGGLLRLSHSAAFGNGTQNVKISPDSVGVSFGNNSIETLVVNLDRRGTQLKTVAV